MYFKIRGSKTWMKQRISMVCDRVEFSTFRHIFEIKKANVRGIRHNDV
jgi:hypothetical protein